MFGLIDLENFDLSGIKIFTRFWGMLMFGTYSVINIVVLLNLLIAMMNHSYQLISVSTIEFCTWEYTLISRNLYLTSEKSNLIPHKFYITRQQKCSTISQTVKHLSPVFCFSQCMLMCSIFLRESNSVGVLKED